MGSGDGMVNLRSSQVCHNWKLTQIKTYAGVNHMEIVKNISVLRDVQTVVFSPPALSATRQSGSAG